MYWQKVLVATPNTIVYTNTRGIDSLAWKVRRHRAKHTNLFAEWMYHGMNIEWIQLSVFLSILLLKKSFIQIWDNAKRYKLPNMDARVLCDFE